MPDAFYLKTLTLKNYRCFDAIELEFKPGINIILGNNGAGKTSALGGAAIALGSWLLGLANVSGRSIQSEEIRLVRKKTNDITVFDSAGECSVTASGVVFEQDDLSWSRTRHTGNTTYKHAFELISVAQTLDIAVSQGEDVILPALAYYGTGRLWGERRLGVVKKSLLEDEQAKGGRYMGYLSALDPASNEKPLKRWIKKLAEASFHEGRVYGALTALYNIITECVEGATKTFWDPREADIVIEFATKEQVPMYLMSDGQRNICAMVGDIAMRCIQLNPHLGNEAPCLTPGVVLIDEVDQHLHPKWQRKVLASLSQSFNNIQFIVTTHSPFIVQSLTHQQVIILDQSMAHTLELGKDLSLEDTAEQVMGVKNPQRSESFNNTVSLGKEIFALQEQLNQVDAHSKEYRDIKNNMDKLRLVLASNAGAYSDNPIVAAYLQGEL